MNVPRLHTATNQAITIEDAIPLHICIGNIHVCVWFGIVENLAVDVLVETSFIKGSVRSIFLAEGKVVPRSLHAVAIIKTHRTAVQSILNVENDRSHNAFNQSKSHHVPHRGKSHEVSIIAKQHDTPERGRLNEASKGNSRGRHEESFEPSIDKPPNDKRVYIRIVRQLHVPAGTESPVLITTKGSDLIILPPILLNISEDRIIPARGMMDVCHACTFSI